MIFAALLGMTMVSAAYYNQYNQGQNWKRYQQRKYGGYQKRYPSQDYLSQTYPQDYAGDSVYPPLPTEQMYNRQQKWKRTQAPSYKRRRAMPVQLEGFDSNQDQLTAAFQEFIRSIPGNILFPIKIDRKKERTGPHVYYYSTVAHSQSTFFGSRESNRSRTVGGGAEINRQFFGLLLQLLDQERWISKIIITFDGQKYIVKKFGVGHSIYRGGVNIAKIAGRRW